VQEVKQRAGETVKPLLGLTLPGPTGYTDVVELVHDVDALRNSLLANHGKVRIVAITLLLLFSFVIGSSKKSVARPAAFD